VAGYNDEKKVLRCSFCNKTQDQVRKLIAGPKGKNVYICDECIDICSEIIEEEFEQYTEDDGEINLRKPKEIKEFLDHWSGRGKESTFRCCIQSLQKNFNGREL